MTSLAGLYSVRKNQFVMTTKTFCQKELERPDWKEMNQFMVLMNEPSMMEK